MRKLDISKLHKSWSTNQCSCCICPKDAKTLNRYVRNNIGRFSVSTAPSCHSILRLIDLADKSNKFGYSEVYIPSQIACIHQPALQFYLIVHTSELPRYELPHRQQRNLTKGQEGGGVSRCVMKRGFVVIILDVATY